LIDECLVAYLHDTRDAWQLDGDGGYSLTRAGRHKLSAQASLMARYAIAKGKPRR